MIQFECNSINTKQTKGNLNHHNCRFFSIASNLNAYWTLVNKDFLRTEKHAWPSICVKPDVKYSWIRRCLSTLFSTYSNLNHHHKWEVCKTVDRTPGTVKKWATQRSNGLMWSGERIWSHVTRPSLSQVSSFNNTSMVKLLSSLHLSRTLFAFWQNSTVTKTFY